VRESAKGLKWQPSETMAPSLKKVQSWSIALGTCSTSPCTGFFLSCVPENRLAAAACSAVHPPYSAVLLCTVLSVLGHLREWMGACQGGAGGVDWGRQV